MHKLIQKPILMVVDDDAQSRTLISEVLNDLDLIILEACCGVEAFNIFNNVHKDIRLVLLDILLPGWNGWQLIKKIRQTNATVPVYAISALHPMHIREKYKSSGFSGYIPKPFDMEHLREIASNFFSLKP